MVKSELDDAFDAVFDSEGANRSQSHTHAHADDGGPVRADWHIELGDEDVGPLTLAEVGRHVESGRVDPTTRVWKKGMRGWVVAGDVAEIDVLFAAPPIPTQARRSSKTASALADLVESELTRTDPAIDAVIDAPSSSFPFEPSSSPPSAVPEPLPTIAQPRVVVVEPPAPAPTPPWFTPVVIAGSVVIAAGLIAAAVLIVAIVKPAPPPTVIVKEVVAPAPPAPPAPPAVVVVQPPPSPPQIVETPAPPTPPVVVKPKPKPPKPPPPKPCLDILGCPDDPVTKPPPPPPLPVTTTGKPLTRIDIIAGTAKNIGSVQACGGKFGATGFARVDFVVQPSGAVNGVKVVDAKTAGTALGNCVVGAVSKWAFPSSSKPSPVTGMPLPLTNAEQK